MGRLLLLLFTLLGLHPARAQCTGQFPANQICGNPNATQSLPTAMDPPYWSSRRVAVTGNKTLASSDCFSIQDLGGSGSYTLTLNAAGGYSTNCFITFYNSDSTRGRFIAPNGVTTFRIFPLQWVNVWSDNGTWTVNRPTRFKLSAAKTVFVDTGGSDTANDCFASGVTGACATMQKAADLVFNEFDLGGNLVTIQGAALQTFAAVTISGAWMSGPNPPGFVPVSVDCANSTITTASAGNTFTLINGGSLRATNCVITATGSVRHGVSTSGTGSLFQCGSGLSFGAVTGTHMFGSNQSRINCNSNYTISGSPGANQAHALASNSAVVVLPTNGTVTFTSNVTTASFIRANFLGQLDARTITWSLGGHTVTASSYTVEYNSVIQTNAQCASVPGSLGGTAVFQGLCQ